MSWCRFSALYSPFKCELSMSCLFLHPTNSVTQLSQLTQTLTQNGINGRGLMLGQIKAGVIAR